MRISDWSSDVCSSDLYSSRSISRLAAAEFAPTSNCRSHTGSVAKIVKLEHAWRRLDGRNDDGFQVAPFPGRSEERRVGKEWVSTVRSRWSALHEKKNEKKHLV